MKKIIHLMLYIWLLLISFEGCLRYVYFKFGLPSLIYLKDIILLIIFAYFIFSTLSILRINKLMLCLLSIVIYGVSVGIINQLPPIQVLFGLKILLSFFVGYIAISGLDLNRMFFLNLFRMYIPLILFGIYLDMFFELPWSGFEYEAFGQDIEGSISWSTFGLPRLAGFGRASYETAILLYSIVTLYLVDMVFRKRKLSYANKLFDIFILIATIAGIIVTTSKSAIFAYFILILFYITIQSYNHFTNLFKYISNILIKSFLYILFLYSIIPPIIAYVSPSVISRHLDSDNVYFLALTLSFRDRIERIWPEAFDLIPNISQYFTGRGIGGIGVAQNYFEKNLYNPADNIYVYIFVDFGIVILSIFLFSLLYKIYVSRLDNMGNIYLYFLCITIFCYGATTNYFESGSLSITSGFMVALWQKRMNNDN